MKVTVENVKANPELAGKALAEKLGWEVFEDGFWYAKTCPQYVTICLTFAKNLNCIAEAEKAVIEKVGGHKYLYDLLLVAAGESAIRNHLEYEYIRAEACFLIATADAATRLTACLLALGVDELE